MKYTHVISGLICIHHGPFVRMIWNIHMWFLDLSVYIIVHLSEWYETYTCDFWTYLYTPWSICKKDMKYTHVISGLICIHHGPFVRMISNVHSRLFWLGDICGVFIPLGGDFVLCVRDFEHTFWFSRAYTYIHIYMHMHIHVHAHTHTYTYIHIYMLIVFKKHAQ